MVSKRIRHVFKVEKESDVKTWNAITANELHGRDGFKKCLKMTLYRPRDVIALLNSAFYQAQRQNRSILTEDDFKASSKQISLTRFDDLRKEYESVLPGISSLTTAFSNGACKYEWINAVKAVETVMAGHGLPQNVMQHFRILGSGEEALKSLYGVGFFGIYDKSHGNFVFSHDGKSPDKNFGSSDVLMIHPCYWSALNLNQEELLPDDAEDIYDEYEITIASQSTEQRSKQLGQIISALNKIAAGEEGASEFEDWCKRAIEIVFARQLSNIQLKANNQATQRRDIVATNEGLDGFWKRVLEDYSTRQVVFEVKNYHSIGIDEYRQVHSYLGKEYGKIGFIICRDSQSGLVKGRELDAFREFYGKDSMIIKITADMLVSMLSKLRSPEKFDAGNLALKKSLDAHIRLYANGQSDISNKKDSGRKK